MEYLKYFNTVCDVLEEGGTVLTDEVIEGLKLAVKRCYVEGVKEGKGVVDKEDMDVHKAVKLQRVMNRYGKR